MTLNSSFLTFDPKSQVLAGEASTLGIGASPRTIIVKSDRTGKKVEFAWVATHRDSGGDVLFDAYRPQEKCGVTWLRVYND